MIERYYGGNKKSYGVTERQDGWIELRVYHNNATIHQLLRKHINDPGYFLRRHNAFSGSNIRAQYWLAKVMDDYRPYFEQSRVQIMLNPDAPYVPTVAPARHVGPHDNLQSLWKSVLANPVPLFMTAAGEPLLAILDEKGFFLSQEAQQIYDQIKSRPHIYVARLESENAYYFGISNQPGGRWKRSHAYHLGGLAYEILNTKRYDDQDHSNWIHEWFEQPLELERRGSHYAVRMKEKVMISFFVPQPETSKAELEMMESALIDAARRKRLIVLNKKS